MIIYGNESYELNSTTIYNHGMRLSSILIKKGIEQHNSSISLSPQTTQTYLYQMKLILQD